MISGVLAGFRLQLWIFRRSLGDLSILIAVPFYLAIFLSITQSADRPDLHATAVLAPALAGMWTLALNQAGGITDGDRWQGTLEPLLATPASFAANVLGRTVAIGALGVVCFAESWVAAALLFGVQISIPHPVYFISCLVATCFAMFGTAALMTTLFTLARSSMIFQNSLSYPFYVLGGILVPVTFLPHWLYPVTRVFFLSWSADLFRATLATGAVSEPAEQLIVIVGLGAISLLLGFALSRRILRVIRARGSVGLA